MLLQISRRYDFHSMPPLDPIRQAPQNVVGRLSLYRRLLGEHPRSVEDHIYSHQLAALAGVSPAQVRRDLMSLRFTGSPSRGYRVAELVQSIERELDSPETESVVLIGIGCLGQALISYVEGRRSKLVISAAFDIDPEKVERVAGGCFAYTMDHLESVLLEHAVRTAILTVPVTAAQDVTDRLVRSGICGILNYSPVRLRVPDHVYVEDLDMTMALERVAYFARQRAVLGAEAR